MGLDIKDLTMQEHKNAERQAFVRILMSGEIDVDLYCNYLWNQLNVYTKLEQYGLENSLFRHTPNLPRSEHILYDFNSLWKHDEKPEVTESTKNYISHLETIRENPEKLYAHIYVRHMGDLSGGQMIRKSTPGRDRYYRFKHKEVGEYGRIIKETINGYLNVYQHSVFPEAKMCFESATELFKEMKVLHDLGKTS